MRSLLAVSVIAVAGAAHAQAPSRPTAMSGYTNPAWRWSISYPAAWKIDSKDRDLIRIVGAGENALCSIHSGPMDRFNTVDEFTDFMVAHDEEFFKGKGQKFSVASRQRIKLANGIVGNDLLAEIGPGGRSRRIHVLHDGRGFAIDCEAYAKDWNRLAPAYERVVTSFTVRR